MTRFERDYNEAMNGNEVAVIKRRQAEINNLTSEGKVCKNAYRAKCIAQEVVRLQRELAEIQAEF